MNSALSRKFQNIPLRPYERFAAVTFEVSHGFLEGLERLMEKTNGKRFIGFVDGVDAPTYRHG
jgi:hypothetical protein